MSDIPRPRSTVHLPCGILYDDDLFQTVEIQEMRDAEERILGSKNPDMKRIVLNCLLQVGSCTDKHIIGADIIPNMRIGDYNAIAYALRRLSLGDSYNYRAKCPNEECNQITSFEVDLATLDVIHMEDPDKDEYEYELRSGETAVFRPVHQGDQKMLEKIQTEKKDVLGKSLAVRLVRVAGEEPEGKTEVAKLKHAVKLMQKHIPSYGEREAIRVWFREERTEETDEEEDKRWGRDGKIDNIIVDECPECGATWRHIMEIDVGFMLPSSEV